MYSPEGQNKTIPLFLQEKQGELLFFNLSCLTVLPLYRFYPNLLSDVRWLFVRFLCIRRAG